MKQEFTKYLNSLNLSDVMTVKINENYNKMVELIEAEEFDDIFLSEGISNDGNREYFRLFGFTENLICRSYFKNLTLGAHQLVNSISLVRFDDYNFDLKTFTESSKIHAIFKRNDAVSSTGLSATGINCKQLMYIYKKYLLPNMSN